MAQPVDDAVSSPGAYLALGLLYTVAALPAIVAPQAVSSGRMHEYIFVLQRIVPLTCAHHGCARSTSFKLQAQDHASACLVNAVFCSCEPLLAHCGCHWLICSSLWRMPLS